MLLLLSLLACNKDTDGDGVLDDFDCDLENADLTLEVLAWADEDGDGFGGGEAQQVCDAGGMVQVGGDCDDGNAEVHPDADELCDGVDNDCSGDVDEEAADQSSWYLDFDGDGFGNAAWEASACEQPEGHVADATDCDDTRAEVNPDAEEVCNGLDDDCDGAADDETATDALTWYADADGDGFGDVDSTLLHCEWQDGYVDNTDDCDDDDEAISPSTEELCDGVDNDCDGAVDHDGWLPGDYSDLEDVMENAPDGAHVCLGEGTFTGGGFERYGDITLQGSGRDVTVIDADYQKFVTFDDSDDLGLLDLEVTRAWATDDWGYGTVVQFESSSDLLLRRVLVSDAGCDTYYYCYAGLAFFDDGGSARIEQVEVDGFTYDGTDGYYYSWFPGMLYGDTVDLTIDGLNIHDVNVTNVYQTLGAGIYHSYGDLVVNDLWIHDNTFTGITYLYGSGFYVDEGGSTVEATNVTLENNHFETDYFYGSFGLYIGGAYGGSVVTNLEVLNNSADVSYSGYPYGWGAYAYYGDHDWQNLLVAGNSIEFGYYGYVYGGLAYVESGSLYLANADFVDNEAIGAYGVYGSVLYSYDTDATMVNTTAANNDFDEATIYGGVYTEDGAFAGAYNNVYDHPIGDGWVYDDDEGDFVEGIEPEYSTDPGYTGGGDYTLGSGSALIDAGDPDILDADGSRSDVGAYGGPYGSWQ